ncbi:MAG: hypothetical protein RBT46_01530 [Weeksellaceae bacterium]|jgi:hypothetical protein|nr:hypothetical protein [Weeksellaceae bacterium]MDX9704375.1 hypothetical protein [Weeksellaceae bacterium]
MFKTKNHIRNTQHIVLMWFVLFALSPCVVKEAFFGISNTEYAKPFNKTRTITPTNSCQYSQNEKQQISVVKQSDINKEIEPFVVSENLFFAVRSIKINNKYSKNSSGNSPPKYILYKRLKLHIA